MKIFSRVTIVCDHTAEMFKSATALRAALEGYALYVDFCPLFQKRQIAEFFARPALDNDYTVLVSHGDGGKQLSFQMVDQVDGNYENVEGWEEVSYALTPDVISETIKDRKGTLISLACGGGREALAKAFLGAGYDHYIGADMDYIHSNSVQLFAAGLFYFLLAEDRDYAPRAYTVPEAVAQAAAFDPEFDKGTRPFRCWSR